MPLDQRGKIAAAEIGFWAPIAVLSALLVVRYALHRDAGWLWMLIFSLSRITEGSLLVAGETGGKTVLFSVAYIMQYSCLFALFCSSLGFVGMAGQRTYSETRQVVTILRATGLASLIGMALCIAGGVIATHANASQNMAANLRRAGTIFYGIVYLALIGVHIIAWTYRWHLRSYRRSLLFGISLALPFLGIRTTYAIAASFSSTDLYGTQLSKDPNLQKINPIHGQWYIYLVLGPVMEYCVALLYMFSSVVLAKKRAY